MSQFHCIKCYVRSVLTVFLFENKCEKKRKLRKIRLIGIEFQCCKVNGCPNLIANNVVVVFVKRVCSGTSFFFLFYMSLSIQLNGKWQV